MYRSQESHGFARARVVIGGLAKDPQRCLVVIDPRRSETARKEDIHLAVKPGTDAWLMAAMAAMLVQKGWVKPEWIAQHTTGFEEVYPVLRNVSVSQFSAICGIAENQ